MEVHVSQNYHAIVREIDPSEGGGYLVEFPDLPGCMADGATREEALKNGDLAKAEWIERTKKLGRKVPEPKLVQDYSGKWVQRVPRSLHRQLALKAEREGVSLNAYATCLLAAGVGE
jgi:antitoxin HicB